MAISREALCGVVGKEGTGEIFDRVLQLVLADGAFIDGKLFKPKGEQFSLSKCYIKGLGYSKVLMSESWAEDRCLNACRSVKRNPSINSSNFMVN